MKVIYVGKDDAGAFMCEQYCHQQGYDFDSILLKENEIFDLTEIRNDLFSLRANYIVCDIANCENTEAEIVDILSNTATATTAHIIVYAPTMTSASKQIHSLKAVGINRCMLDFDQNNIGTAKDLLHDCMTLQHDPDPQEAEEIISNREKIQETVIPASLATAPSKRKTTSQTIRIGVVGIMPRVGCTTVALQIVKHINLNEENAACYIQVSGDYVTNLKKYYNVDEYPDGTIGFEGIKIFPSPTQITDIVSAGFQYLIYDYGDINTADRIGLLERDIIIVVGMTGPTELAAFGQALETTYTNPVTNYVLYNAPVDPVDRSSFLASCASDKQDRIYFIENTPDPFIYNMDNSEVIDKMLDIKLPEVDPYINKPKARMFKR